MQLFTVGHSTYPLEDFINLLKKNDVQYIIDVRSTPYSKYAPQYNSNILEKELNKHKIRYFHMGKFFGARQTEKRYYNAEGYLDFELFRESDAFKKGVNNIEIGLKKYNIALMCTEKHPIDCHREIMVARGFELAGIDVKHILPDGSVISQQEVNRMLLDMYFPERMQLSIFDIGHEKGEDEYLVEAYRYRNKEIGYRFSDDGS